jgi:hypothetical protein
LFFNIKNNFLQFINYYINNINYNRNNNIYNTNHNIFNINNNIKLADLSLSWSNCNTGSKSLGFRRQTQG